MGDDFLCDAGNETSNFGRILHERPLFSDEWFQVAMPAPTTDDVELRLMSNEAPAEEDMLVEQLEVYIR